MLEKTYPRDSTGDIADLEHNDGVGLNGLLRNGAKVLLEDGVDTVQELDHQ